MADGEVNQLMSVHIPLMGALGPSDGDRKGPEVPTVVGNAAGDDGARATMQGKRTSEAILELLKDGC